MNVHTDLPQVAALRLAVKRRLGRSLACRSDFTILASEIERVTREHIAENTLRRIWGRMKSYGTVFGRTLDVLSRYAGFDGWDAFCAHLREVAGIESDLVRDVRSVRTEDLRVGDRLRIGWLPDRLCVVEFGGGRTFRAVETENSTMRPGDTFECGMFILGYPLAVDNFVHDSETVPRYVMGTDHGLTTLERL